MTPPHTPLPAKEAAPGTGSVIYKLLPVVSARWLLQKTLFSTGLSPNNALHPTARALVLSPVQVRIGAGRG